MVAPDSNHRCSRRPNPATGSDSAWLRRTSSCALCEVMPRMDKEYFLSISVKIRTPELDKAHLASSRQHERQSPTASANFSSERKGLRHAIG